jgi:glutamate-1-semialdehyde 2,1-aminomutase
MNKTIFEKIKNIIPGGIDGNAKVFSGDLPVIVEGKGPYLKDAEGKTYIDYISGYGPLFFGHADSDYVQYINDYMKKGLLYGLPHELMYKAGEKIIETVPSAEMVRFTNTGTEATLNAIRLARGVTGRDKIIKFYGAYHGTHDFVLIGSKIIHREPSLPFAESNSAGIPMGVQQDVFTLEFNDSQGFKDFMSQHGEEIAAVIVEPIIGSYGIAAEQEFMNVLREETEKYGTVLIFDEIITGFRLGIGGAQEWYGVTPDLTTLGKVLGGGVPVGAFVGKRSLMERIIPKNDPITDARESIYHSGTFNANPLALAGCLWVLTKLSENPGIYQSINAKADRLREGFKEVMNKHGIQGVTTGKASIFQWYFGLEQEPKRFQDVLKADKPLLQKFHRELVKLGVLFIASPRGFVGSTHSNDDIEKTIELADIALSNCLK